MQQLCSAWRNERFRTGAGRWPKPCRERRLFEGFPNRRRARVAQGLRGDGVMARGIIIAGLMGAALLAAGCREAISPQRSLPGAIQLDVAAPSSGIVFDTLNSSLDQHNNFFIKGFNPRSPRPGDAIVVTVFWVGSGANIVDSVTDHLARPDFPPVGNRYTLVQYVSSDSLSMATYVATNVQGYPYPTEPNVDVLAVRANLSRVADGGIMMAAWSGVDGVFAQALGDSRSAFGAASSESLVGPGPISVNAGALAYAVTMSRAQAGRFPPQGFGNMLSMGAGTFRMTTEADSAVQANAGSVDPQWRWFFQNDPTCTTVTPCTWLASVLALNSGSAPPPPPPPPPPNQPPTAAFTASCSVLACTFTSTSSDPDGSITAYAWSFGDGGTSTAPNPSHIYTSEGTYTVQLTVTDDQGATSTTSQSVTVTLPNSPPVVNAGPDETAVTGLGYSTSVSFTDANNNGPWSYTINWGDGSTSTGSRTSQGSFTVSHTYVVLLPTTFTVTVTVTDAAGASGSDTKKVTVFLL